MGSLFLLDTKLLTQNVIACQTPVKGKINGKKTCRLLHIPCSD